jgi:bifunctional non-homologous end joining protein LigD
LKFKFVATVSAMVTRINLQRSVEVGLYQGDRLVPCGNVTIPANQEIPSVGTIVEVRYLYAYRDSLALYQPVYLGVREDTDAAECVIAQLKFKAE